MAQLESSAQMPLSIPFAESLVGNVLTILLQSGWGWKKMSDSGEWSAFDPPQVLLPVRDIELVQPSYHVLGFTGQINSARVEFSGMSLMAFTHTMEICSEDDSIPLSFVISPGMPKCVPD